MSEDGRPCATTGPPEPEDVPSPSSCESSDVVVYRGHTDAGEGETDAGVVGTTTASSMSACAVSPSQSPVPLPSWTADCPRTCTGAGVGPGFGLGTGTGTDTGEAAIDPSQPASRSASHVPDSDVEGLARAVNGGRLDALKELGGGGPTDCFEHDPDYVFRVQSSCETHNMISLPMYDLPGVPHHTDALFLALRRQLLLLEGAADAPSTSTAPSVVLLSAEDPDATARERMRAARGRTCAASSSSQPPLTAASVEDAKEKSVAAAVCHPGATSTTTAPPSASAPSTSTPTSIPSALTRPSGPLADVWRSPSLLLSQTCGLPLVTVLGPAAVRVVAAPVYSAPGCDGATYTSVLVVREGDPAEAVPHLVGRRAAINSTDSLSGFVLLLAAVGAAIGKSPPPASFFSEIVVTGAHSHSVEAVRSGAADVAAIDCVSWAVLCRAHPLLSCGVRVLATSPPAPSLPFITSSASSGGTISISTLRKALTDSLADAAPAAVAARDALFLVGMDTTATYDRYDTAVTALLAAAVPPPPCPRPLSRRLSHHHDAAWPSHDLWCLLQLLELMRAAARSFSGRDASEYVGAPPTWSHLRNAHPARVTFAKPGAPEEVVAATGGGPGAGLLWFVGFLGATAATMPAEVNEEAWRLDAEVMASLPGAQDVLAYASACRSNDRGDWANLVVLRSEEAVTAFSAGPAHAKAIHSVAPHYYTHVRIHRGRVGGEGPPFSLQRTLCLQYGAPPDDGTARTLLQRRVVQWDAAGDAVPLGMAATGPFATVVAAREVLAAAGFVSAPVAE